ncbi:MAG: hypothetical protein M3O50_13370 [Myxococcota bacterium]|nr:hypothetical protein [Myxococcota bacterium]
MLPVGPDARIAFAALWIAGQAGLILSAARQPDHIFGFRMFPEASTMEIHLAREVAGLVVPAPKGEWQAIDGTGTVHPFSWSDRVRDPVLGTLDARVFASYGVDAQLARLQRALDDVADHIPDDADTTRLRAEVVLRRNGGDPASVTLVSHARQAQ